MCKLATREGLLSALSVPCYPYRTAAPGQHVSRQESKETLASALSAHAPGVHMEMCNAGFLHVLSIVGPTVLPVPRY